MQDAKKNMPGIAPPTDSPDNQPRRDSDSSRLDTARAPENIGLLSPETPRQMFYDLYAQNIALKMRSEKLQRMQARLKQDREQRENSYHPDKAGTEAGIDGFSRRKAVRIKTPSAMYLIATDSGEMASVLDFLRLDRDVFTITPCDIREVPFPARDCPEKQSPFGLLTGQNRQLEEERERQSPVEDLLRENERCLQSALDTSSTGLWDLNLLTGEVSFGENWYRRLGYEQSGAIANDHAWQNLIHPDDRNRVLAMRDAHVHGITDCYEAEYRVKNVAGEWVRIVSQGRIVARDGDGKALRMVGTHTDISRRIQAEAEPKRVRFELEQRIKELTTELYETNIALKVLLKKREEDKKTFENSVKVNIEKLVEPFLTRLEECRLTEQQQLLVGILRSNIEELTSPFADTFSARLSRLTPVEIQVANLVKLGKRTKEVAQIMHLSAGTISIHRKNIRKKLDLTHRKTNLQSILTINIPSQR
jgi:PAS domain S-box-containing protein